MYGYYQGFGSHDPFGGFVMIVFGFFIVLFVIWLIKSSMSHMHHGHMGNTSLDILKERYAKGEINKEEFEIKKKDLSI